MKLVIVESPAKSKTINKYLGSGYKVLASMGHVRDLPSKDGSVRPDEDFAMTYEIDPGKSKTVQQIAKEAKEADEILLATDPDREGEAISWHVLESLKQKKAIKKNTAVHRVVFNEITKNAVLNAIKNPRDLDMSLVNAQQARRALDYLVGFTLSPVLWRKLPGSRSAGRVQSVALRLICDREDEIEKFISEEYWDLEADFSTPRSDKLTARLVTFRGQKCEKFSFRNQAEAATAKNELEKYSYSVASVGTKQVRRTPPPPFTTSTLQQEAARKLGFSSKQTMQIAQKLYEGISLGGETVGLITYMRTDGVYVSNEAINEARSQIKSQYGDNYLPDSPRMYQSKTKNAQEAHEAIRPTSLRRTPDSVADYLDSAQAALYALVYKRMLASQMANAVLDQTTIDISSNDGKAGFRATGSIMRFPGFFALYHEDIDDGKDEEDRLLPDVKEKENLGLGEVRHDQHFTEPPPRYSEASLVKKLEELGIGRPSTYAAIISVLQDRAYVVLEKKRFMPEDRGRIVTAFLKRYFSRYVEYDFTAGLEDQLDEISDGKIEWKSVLRDFWKDFSKTTEGTKELMPSEILKEIEEVLSFHLFPPTSDGSNPRHCPRCNNGSLSLKAGKFGAFLGCSNYPECNYTREMGVSAEEAAENPNAEYPKTLGTDGTDKILLKLGPYGLYVERENGEKKPPRTSLPKSMNPDEMTLEKAVALLSLPRTIGEHPETGKKISAGIGRFGPYVLHDGVYASVPAGEDVLDIGMNRAVTLLAEKAARKPGSGRTAATPLRELGSHPDDGAPVQVFSGRYGPYVKHGKINATIPKNLTPESVTLEQAAELLAARADKPVKKTASRRKKA